MSAFTDMLAADAVAAFCDPDGGFADRLVYTSKDGSTRTVNAVVFRAPPGPVKDAKGAGAPSLTVFVPNDPAVGVLFVTTKADRITVAEREGEQPRPHPVLEVVNSDPGGWTLRLR